MAELVAAIDTSIEVEFYQFVVQDQDGLQLASAVEPMPRADNILVGGPGGLRLYSFANDHSPAVRLELWDVRPPAGLPGWQPIGESTFTVEGRRLRLWSVTAAQSAEELELPQAGGYTAQVYLQGREAAERLEEATFVHGVERWVIRIWPTHE